MVPIVRLGALAGLAVLGSCSQHLNMSRIENRIQDDIERQGRRLSLKAVICPNRVAKQAEAYFRCVGELPDGGQFTINVTQQDDQGNVAWDVPSSKVLINLASLEAKIQEGTKEAVGKSLAIDCGHTYRASKRGESFECDVVGAGTVAAGRVESVLVKIGGDGDLTWQEVLISNGSAAPASQSTGTAPTPAPAATPTDNTPDDDAATTAAAKPTEADSAQDTGDSEDASEEDAQSADD